MDKVKRYDVFSGSHGDPYKYFNEDGDSVDYTEYKAVVDMLRAIVKADDECSLEQPLIEAARAVLARSPE